MVNRTRRGPRVLRPLLAAAVASIVAFVVAPAALADTADPVLTVRGIDATDSDNVQITLAWNGSTEALSGLTVREDGVSQQLQPLVPLRKAGTRLATVVLVDVSGSMADDGALTRAKAGIDTLVDQLGSGDQMAVVSFTNDVTVESGFSSDAGQLKGAVEDLVAPRDGRTALYDGLRKAASMLDGVDDLQPNIVLVTDGFDDASEASLASTRAALVSSGAALYVVDLNHVGQTDTKNLGGIIARTGGTIISAASEKDVKAAFQSFSTALNSQFVASYKSNATQGSVNVTVGLGSQKREVSYVVGAKVEGAATGQVVTKPSSFGPAWLRSGTGALVAFALVGLAMALGAYAFASLATKDNSGLTAMLQPYAEDGGMTEGDGALAQTAILQRAVELTEDFAKKQGILEKVENKLERADWPLRAAEALFFYAAIVVVVALLGLVTGGLFLGLILGVLAALLPMAIVNFKASRRSKAFVAQLPDTLHLLSGSLRAGYSFLQGVEAVSKEVEEPMGKELRRVITEARLGREVEDAMDSVAERMESPDFAWAVMAVRIQREVGGNLSELLLTVAETMVQRDRLRRDVAALTAEGKMSAIILGLLPVGLGAFMWMSNPVYMSPLQTTLMGNILLGLAVVSCVIGFAWMKKTITIEI